MPMSSLVEGSDRLVDLLATTASRLEMSTTEISSTVDYEQRN